MPVDSMTAARPATPDVFRTVLREGRKKGVGFIRECLFSASLAATGQPMTLEIGAPTLRGNVWDVKIS
jgi:hypothetical protein